MSRIKEFLHPESILDYSVCRNCYVHIGTGNHSDFDECFEPEAWKETKERIEDRIAREIEFAQKDGKSAMFTISDTADDYESEFSWHSCELCGSHLAGSRYTVSLLIIS